MLQAVSSAVWRAVDMSSIWFYLWHVYYRTPTPDEVLEEEARHATTG